MMNMQGAFDYFGLPENASEEEIIDVFQRRRSALELKELYSTPDQIAKIQLELRELGRAYVAAMENTAKPITLHREFPVEVSRKQIGMIYMMVVLVLFVMIASRSMNQPEPEIAASVLAADSETIPERFPDMEVDDESEQPVPAAAPVEGISVTSDAEMVVEPAPTQLVQKRASGINALEVKSRWIKFITDNHLPPIQLSAEQNMQNALAAISAGNTEIADAEFQTASTMFESSLVELKNLVPLRRQATELKEKITGIPQEVLQAWKLDNATGEAGGVFDTAEQALGSGSFDSAGDAYRNAAALYQKLWEQIQSADPVLRIETVPENARIRIMNIRPRYQSGMLLQPGKYDLEISAEGYQTYRKWIPLDAGTYEPVVIHLER
jgi:hypothetical protein